MDHAIILAAPVMAPSPLPLAVANAVQTLESDVFAKLVMTLDQPETPQPAALRQTAAKVELAQTGPETVGPSPLILLPELPPEAVSQPLHDVQHPGPPSPKLPSLPDLGPAAPAPVAQKETGALDIVEVEEGQPSEFREENTPPVEASRQIAMPPVGLPLENLSPEPQKPLSAPQPALAMPYAAPQTEVRDTTALRHEPQTNRIPLSTPLRSKVLADSHPDSGVSQRNAERAPPPQPVEIARPLSASPPTKEPQATPRRGESRPEPTKIEPAVLPEAGHAVPVQKTIPFAAPAPIPTAVPQVKEAVVTKPLGETPEKKPTAQDLPKPRRAAQDHAAERQPLDGLPVTSTAKALPETQMPVVAHPATETSPDRITSEQRQTDVKHLRANPPPTFVNPDAKAALPKPDLVEHMAELLVMPPKSGPVPAPTIKEAAFHLRLETTQAVPALVDAAPHTPRLVDPDPTTKADAELSPNNSPSPNDPPTLSPKVPQPEQTLSPSPPAPLGGELPAPPNILPSNHPLADPVQTPSAASPPQQAASALAQGLPLETGRIELTLTPEDLGSLRFEIHRKGDDLNIVMSAERPETLDLMRRQLPDLIAELKQAGVQGGTLSFGAWSDRPPPQQQNLAAFLTQTEPDAPATPTRPSPLARPTGKGLDLRL